MAGLEIMEMEEKSVGIVLPLHFLLPCLATSFPFPSLSFALPSCPSSPPFP